MKVKKLLIYTLLCLIVIFSFQLQVTAQEEGKKNKLTRQNIFMSGIFRQLPGGFRWLPDGKSFLYTNRGSHFLYELESGEQVRLFNPRELRTKLMKDRKTRSQTVMGNTNATGRFNRSAMVMSPDSSSLSGLMENDLYIYDLSTGEARFLTNTGAVEEFQVFSPDSKKIAYVKNHDIYVLDLECGHERRMTDNEGNDEIWNGVADWVYEEELSVRQSFWWSPDSSKLAYLQFDTSPVEYFQIIDHMNLKPNPEKQKFALTGSSNSIVKLGILDLETRQTLWVDTGEDTDVYIYDASWNHSGNALSYQWMNRPQQRIELRFADPVSGKSRVAVVEEDDTWVNARTTWMSPGRMLYFLEDDSFLWLSERTGFFHIYHFDSEGKLLRQLTDGQWQVENIQSVNEDDKTIFFSATEASPLERNLYSVNLDGSNFRRMTTEKGNNTAIASPDGSYFVNTNSAADRQRKIGLYDADGKKLEQFASDKNPRLAKVDFNHTKLVKIKAEDGETLYGAITLPPGFDQTKKYPVIVYVYGGMGIQIITNSWSPMMIFTHQLSAADGFIMFSLDNRGAWGRGHAFEEKIYKRTGDWELRDQLDGVKYLKTLQYVDADRIGITGGSYGGYMTLMAMFKAPEIFKVGVAQSPGTGWEHYDTAYTERYMGTPSANPEGYKASDPAQYASGLQGKLYIVHGMMDNNVHVQQVFQLMDALIKAGKDFKLMLYPQERHGISTPYRAMHNMNSVADYFVKHLKGDQ